MAKGDVFEGVLEFAFRIVFPRNSSGPFFEMYDWKWSIAVGIFLVVYYWARRAYRELPPMIEDGPIMDQKRKYRWYRYGAAVGVLYSLLMFRIGKFL